MDAFGFCWKPWQFFGVLNFPPFDHPRHLKCGVAPGCHGTQSFKSLKYIHRYLGVLKLSVTDRCQ